MDRSYGGRANPYAQQNNSYDGPVGAGYGQAAPPSYGGNPYGGARPAMGRDEFGGPDVEMEPLTGNANNQFPRQQADPNQILNECANIDQGVQSIEEMMGRLDQSQRRFLGDPDTSASSPSKRAVEDINNEILAAFREITGQVKRMKSRPEAGNPRNTPQIGRLTRRLKDVRLQYQQQNHQFETAMRDQAKKQARIVMPEASEQDLNAFVDDPSNTQVFSQALMQSNRRGQAQSVMGAVASRHAEIQKIEQQMIELAELFQEMESLVVQQEVAVVNIEQKGEEVQDNLYKGNEQISTAIVSARSRNRKKWWCLLVVGMLCRQKAQDVYANLKQSSSLSLLWLSLLYILRLSTSQKRKRPPLDGVLRYSII